MPGNSHDKATENPQLTAAPSSDSKSRRERRASEARPLRSNRVSWAVLVVMLTFAPLAFGAVEYWAIAIVEFLAAVLAVSWIVGAVRREELRLNLNPFVISALGLMVWIALELALGRTIDRAETRHGLLLLASYFLIFLVATNESWSNRWIGRLALAIASIGFVIAVFGIIQFFTWNGKIYWLRPTQVGTPFGPYVNRNHFAGLMEMTIPIVLGHVLMPRLSKTWKAFLTFFAVVMGLALFMSMSRGGMVSLAFSLVVFVYFAAQRLGARPVLLTLGGMAALVAVWLVWLGAEPVLRRLSTLKELSPEAPYAFRITIAKTTLEMIQDHPLTGTGLGTYALAIPPYITTPQKLVWGEAHNDYLQLLAETGLIGFAFAVWWVVALFHFIWKLARDSAHPISPLRLGAFCGCLSILVHSLVDFNLQIPANALYFAVVAALATRASSTEQRRVAPESTPAETDARA